MAANADRLEAQVRGTDRMEVSVLRQVVTSVVVAPEQLTVELERSALVQLLLGEDARDREPARSQSDAADQFAISVPWQVKRRGVEKRIVLDGGEGAGLPDPHLVALIGKAHRVLALLTSGGEASIAAAAPLVGIDRIEASRILPLAFLAPDITRAIVAGRAPPELTATALGRIRHLPTDWSAQRRLLGFADPR
ncbi:hypothetical protein [Acuticoccus sp.]|uniref:hypothetical protein n=1 Tax=Acuticoccus sp. TaxID=1904378 RepID=UPI003B519CB1